MQNSQQMGAQQPASQGDARQSGAQTTQQQAQQGGATTQQNTTVRFSDWAAI